MKSRLAMFILLVSFSLCLISISIANAYQPIVTVGKPVLRDIYYSPDGRYLATLTDSFIELLDAETLEPVSRIYTPENNTDDLIISPDGSLMAVHGRNGIYIFEIASGEIFATIPVFAYATDFSPDGRYLAYSEDTSVFLWDIQQKKVVRELMGDPEHVLSKIQSINFHPSGKLLAVASYSQTIALLNVETGNTDSILDTENGTTPDEIKFSNDGALLSVLIGSSGPSSVIELFNVADGSWKYVWGIDIASMAFTVDDNYLLIGNGDGYLGIYNIKTGVNQRKQAIDRLPPPNVGNADPLERLAIHPDGKKFASLYHRNGCGLFIWNTRDFTKIQSLYGWGGLWQAAYLPDVNRVVTGIYTNVLCFWDATTGELLNAAQFHSTIWKLKASPDGRRIGIDTEATNQIWDASTGKQLQVFQIGGYLGTEAIEFSPSGKYFASNNYRGIYIWNVETGEEINVLPASWSFLLLSFTSDELQIFISPEDENGIEFWDIETGKLVRKINHLGPIVSVGDDFIQAREGEKGIDVVLVNSDRLLCHIPAEFQLAHYNPSFIFGVAGFHPSGGILFIHYQTDTDSRYELYNSQTGEPLASLYDVKDLRFAGNGDYLLLENGKNELSIYLTSDMLNGPIPVAVNPSGRQITTFGRIKQDQLLQNYPNPFNPDTWIPYQLAEDGDVKIDIYNSSGQLVRILELGHRKEGSHQVHWDGRDNEGQNLASGVYFYTLKTADRFSDTRKMVLLK